MVKARVDITLPDPKSGKGIVMYKQGDELPQKLVAEFSERAKHLLASFEEINGDWKPVGQVSEFKTKEEKKVEKKFEEGTQLQVGPVKKKGKK